MMTDGNPRPIVHASRRSLLTAAGAGAAFALAGCVGGDDDGNGGENGGDNGGANGGENGGDELTGSIRISGSSTVFPVAQAVANTFTQDEHPQTDYDLSKDGSGGGFRNVFIPGDSDINNASRPIKDSESSDCQENGIDPIEFRIAQDALTIVVNNDNDWVDEMEVSTVGEIWDPETAPETWADVSAADDDWPDMEFNLFGAATTSGTFDYFTEAVVGEEDSIRDDYSGTERDDQIAAGVSGDEAAFGYLPFAYYVNNPDSVKALSLIGESGEAVQPSLDAAQSGAYPLARPLFFYVNNNKLADNPTLQEFVRFYIEQSGEDFIADQIGYVPSSDDQVQSNLDKLEEQL
jgi:phosphate transport system substrate-binding protein